jgi:SAM-dependent methyltransferase
VLDLEKESLGQTFDAVLCTEVIEHLDDRTAGIANLARMVAPGGHLVITCPTGKLHATERHFGHVSHPTARELATLLGANGLEVVSLQSWGFPVYAAMKYLTNVRADWALRNFASGEYSAGAKAISKALYLANFLNLPSVRFGCQLFVLARRPAR